MYISDVQKKVPDTINCTEISFNFYTNFFGQNKLEDISLSEWLEIIKNNPRKKEITLLRSKNLPKDKLNQEEKPKYRVIAPHAKLKGTKKKENFVSLTGLLFIDVDGDIDADKCKDTIFALPEVIAVWKSLSGKGVHALAQVNNLPTNSAEFQKAHETYLDQLKERTGLKFDKKVCRLAIGMVESYDSEILIKSSWETYNLVYLPFPGKQAKGSIKEEEKKGYSLMPVSAGTSTWHYKLKLDTYPEQVVYIPEGRLFFQCYLPFDPETGRPKLIGPGSRNVFLSSFLNNFILLNPGRTYEEFLSYMKIFNQARCLVPVPEEEVIEILNKQWVRRNEAQPIDPKTKYYWIDPTVTDKNKALGEKRKAMTQASLEEFFSELPNYECKITQKIISQYTGLGERTVRQHLTPHMIKLIKSHNTKYLKPRGK